jgi:hypothetical protein
MPVRACASPEAARAARRQVPGDSLAAIEAALPEPTSVWQKLLPLAVIFFCASFNLTLIQNASHSLMARRLYPTPTLSAYAPAST